MPARKYSVEQIIAKLREMERLQGEGLSIPAASKRIRISDQTFYRWRLKYGAMKEDEARRLKALEQENSRLKKIVAEQALEIVPGQVSWTLSASDRLGPAAWTASGVRKPVAPWGLMRL